MPRWHISNKNIEYQDIININKELALHAQDMSYYITQPYFL